MGYLTIIKAFLAKFWPFIMLALVIGCGYFWLQGEKKASYLEGRYEVQSLWDAAKLLDKEAQVQAEAKHAADKKAWEKGLQTVQKGYIDEVAKAKTVGNRALADNRSLRDALSAASGSGGPVPSSPGAACGPHDQYIGLLKRLLVESGDLVAEGLSRIAELEAKVTGLQEAIRVYLARSKPADA